MLSLGIGRETRLEVDWPNIDFLEELAIDVDAAAGEHELSQEVNRWIKGETLADPCLRKCRKTVDEKLTPG